MAVEKMFFVNIVGHKENFDSLVVNNILPYEIELVDAYPLLKSIDGLKRFREANPYQDIVKRIEDMAGLAGQRITYEELNIPVKLDAEKLKQEISELERKIEEKTRLKYKLEKELKYAIDMHRQILPIKDIDIDIAAMFNLKNISFRFGKMPIENYQVVSEYIKNIDAIVFKNSVVDEMVYLMYYTPKTYKFKIDSLFASHSFERIWLSEDIKGKPIDMYAKMTKRIEGIKKKKERIEEDLSKEIMGKMDRLRQLYSFAKKLDSAFDVRKYSVHSQETFYLAGWIQASKIKAFQREIDKVDDLNLITEDIQDISTYKPPTSLKNNKFFKPFEFLVEMYGLPLYNEIDPTPFLAITYLLFFGIMFGDLGQGLVISLLSFILYKKKAIKLAKIGIYLGGASSIFGIFYGSFFGNEEILRRLLPFIPMINPMDKKIEVLSVSVVLGIFLIIVAMCLNIYNQYKAKSYGKLIVDKNGLIGLVFYIALIYMGFRFVSSKPVPPIYIIFLIILPILILFFAKPLENLIMGSKEILPKDKGGFIIESAFEIIEVLLSILSNTISFVRIGAFALNHVGFFMAFHILSNLVGGSGSILVMVFGNILIIVLEGLVVGIQGLRLEYYELFSRFYTSGGKSFKPYKIETNY